MGVVALTWDVLSWILGLLEVDIAEIFLGSLMTGVSWNGVLEVWNERHFI